MIFDIDGINISFYGCVYALGFVLMLIMVKGSALYRALIAVYVAIGAIVGGRMGYVLFYDFSFYAHHESEILRLDHGGMSFHGAVLGVLLSLYLIDKKHFWRNLDAAAICAMIALPLGRIANFFNAELYGTPTTVPWAVIFSTGGLIPRHPVQIYEAICEGPIAALICFCAQRVSTRKRAFAPNGARTAQPGLISSVFIISYGVLRFICEFFREPDPQLGYIIGPFTLGQILCVIIAAVGLIAFRHLHRQNAKKLGE